MKKFVCKNLKYIFAQNAEINISGEIVQKTGFQFIEIFSREKIELVEKGKEKDGNTLYEQELEIQSKYSSISDIQKLHDAHLIIKLSNVDDVEFVWGSLLPYNPVQLLLTTGEKIADINFYRLSHLPEVP